MSRKGEILRIKTLRKTEMDEKEPIPIRYRAILGDGAGNTKPDYHDPTIVYVRREGRGLVEECLCTLLSPRYNLPVIVGYTPAKPDRLQVLEVDWDTLAVPGPYSYVPHHHQSHELYNIEGGDDVVYSRKQQYTPLLLSPTDPVSMQCYVWEDRYPDFGIWKWYSGGITVDFALGGYVPGVGLARWVLVVLDCETNTVDYVLSDTFSDATPPALRLAVIPAAPNRTMTAGAVYLPNGLTEIDWPNLEDVRMLNSPFGGILPAAHALLGPEHSDTLPTIPPPQGSMIYGLDGAMWNALPIGTAYQLLTTNAAGTLPEWDSFDWDNLATAAAADMMHDHTSDVEGGVTKAEVLTWIGW